MKHLLFLLFTGLHSALFAQANDSIIQSDTIYQYRKNHYSQLFGFEPDTIENPMLYETVEKWLFTNYRYGGKTEKGIDCSDFSAVLYDKAYQKKISGNSASLCAQSTKVKKEHLKEGDLVFFRIHKKRVSHVGVYLSKNKFAHASVKSGVIISDLNEAYYKKHFFQGGRLPE